MRNTINALWASAAALAASVVPVLAQGAEGEQKTPVAPGAGNVSLPTATQVGLADFTIADLISTAVRLLVVIAAVVFFVWLLLGGIRWITSGGDKQKTEEARAQITAALVGLVIVFAAWAIAQLINVLFDFDLFTLSVPPVGGK